MLIRYNNNPIVNLDNVSNVFIDRKNNKVIFNMNYSVKLGEKMTADYEYWNYENLEEIVSVLDNTLEKAGFITPNSVYNRYVNSNCISSIKVDERNLKIIYNLNSTVTHPDDSKKIDKGINIPLHKQRLTSDFVFIRFTNIEDYYDYFEKLEDKMITI